MNPRLQHVCALSALALLPLLPVASACAQSVEGQLYAPGAFERLELAGSANVKLTQGERDQVFIAGGPELQKTVELDYNSERLRIRSTGGWKFWSNNRLQIEVMMRKISALALSGASDLHASGPVKSEKLAISISGAGLARMDDLNVQQLLFAVSGAGDGQLRGQAGELRLQISGKGKLLAENLHATRAYLSISGIGGANVWVSDELRVHVSGIGSVDYWGLPTLTRGSAGIANITSRGDKPWPPGNASSASSPGN
jgi:hypothetical protein